MSEIRYFLGKRWTTLEIVLWLSVLVGFIALCALAATGVIGREVLLVGPVATAGVGLMRYRAEKREAADHQAE
jgi:hypothetical protein